MYWGSVWYGSSARCCASGSLPCQRLLSNRPQPLSSKTAPKHKNPAFTDRFNTIPTLLGAPPEARGPGITDLTAGPAGPAISLKSHGSPASPVCGLDGLGGAGQLAPCLIPPPRLPCV